MSIHPCQTSTSSSFRYFSFFLLSSISSLSLFFQTSRCCCFSSLHSSFFYLLSLSPHLPSTPCTVIESFTHPFVFPTALCTQRRVCVPSSFLPHGVSAIRVPQPISQLLPIPHVLPLAPFLACFLSYVLSSPAFYRVGFYLLAQQVHLVRLRVR